MMDYKKALDIGLYLDDYNFFIDWYIDKKSLLAIFSHSIKYEIAEDSQFEYCGFRVIAKVFGLKEAIGITFNFVKEKMTSVNIYGYNLTPQNSVYDNYIAFEAMQNYLEEILGKPNNFSKFFSKFFETKDSRTYKWHFNKVTVKHYIFDRFGLVEYLEIIIK
jgi:hypothetical protein